MFLGSPLWQNADIWAWKTGIGTYVAKHGPGFFTPIVKNMSKALDEAVAWNFASHTQRSCQVIYWLGICGSCCYSWLRIFDATPVMTGLAGHSALSTSISFFFWTNLVTRSVFLVFRKRMNGPSSGRDAGKSALPQRLPYPLPLARAPPRQKQGTSPARLQAR